MSSLWDTICKILIRDHPHALLQLVGEPLIFVQARPTELKEIDLHLDSLIEVLLNGEHILLHLEFQTYNDISMAERLLRYNVLTRMQHKLPVLSCVLYLTRDGTVPDSPLRWHLPGKPDTLIFQFESIEISRFTPDDLRRIGSIELLTLLPLTKGGASREIIEEMLEQLRKSEQRNLEAIGFGFASLAVRKDPIATRWLQERINSMQDTLGDIPIFQYIKEQAIEQGLEQGLEQGRAKERNDNLQQEKNMLLKIIKKQYPQLISIAQEQVDSIHDLQTVRDIILDLFSASTSEQAMHCLVNWHEQ